MKKLLSIALCLAVAACQPHEFDPDVDRAQAKRNIAEARYVIEKGCPFAREDESFKNCVYATYMKSSPKTFKAAELEDGQPIAIVSNARRQAMTVKTVKTTTVETTEKVMTPTGITETTHEPVVTQTTDEFTIRDKQSATMTITQPKTITVREEVILQPIPRPVVTKKTEAKPAPQPVATKKTEAKQPPQKKPEPKKTWWDEYQSSKSSADASDDCDCNNPNDACPRCYNK